MFVLARIRIGPALALLALLASCATLSPSYTIEIESSSGQDIRDASVYWGRFESVGGSLGPGASASHHFISAPRTDRRGRGAGGGARATAQTTAVRSRGAPPGADPHPLPGRAGVSLRPGLPPPTTWCPEIRTRQELPPCADRENPVRSLRDVPGVSCRHGLLDSTDHGCSTRNGYSSSRCPVPAVPRAPSSCGFWMVAHHGRAGSRSPPALRRVSSRGLDGGVHPGGHRVGPPRP